MATRSVIIADMGTAGQPPRSDAWAVITVHNGGEPEHRASLLLDYDSDPAKVRGLIALGNLSSIDREITCPPGHGFDTPIAGFTVAYGRDRNDEDENDDEGARFCPTLKAALENATEDHVYVYRDGSWWWAPTDGVGPLPEDLQRLRWDSRSSPALDG